MPFSLSYLGFALILSMQNCVVIFGRTTDDRRRTKSDIYGEKISHEDKSCRKNLPMDRCFDYQKQKWR